MRLLAALSIRSQILASTLVTAAALAQSPSGEFFATAPESLPHSYFNSPTVLAPLASSPSPSTAPEACYQAPESAYQVSSLESMGASTGGLPTSCESCPTHGFYGFFGYDSWRGHQDDG